MAVSPGTSRGAVTAEIRTLGQMCGSRAFALPQSASLDGQVVLAEDRSREGGPYPPPHPGVKGVN